MAYELHYWPGIPGRGEFVRLAFEAAGADYVDIAQTKDGMRRMQKLMADPALARPPFACPFLVDGKRVIGQTALILQYLGPRLGLVGASDSDRTWTQQIQLTIADVVAEAHDVHHPVASSLYYEDQKPEALRRALEFRNNRMPKYMQWFETVLQRNVKNRPGRAHRLVGARLSYADLSLFQLVEGLRHAFPNASRKVLRRTPRVVALRDAVAGQRRVAAYLASERRIAFNEGGIFRRYPELDASR